MSHDVGQKHSHRHKLLYTAPSVEHIRRYHRSILTRLFAEGFDITLVVGEGRVESLGLPVSEIAICEGLVRDPAPSHLNELKAIIQRNRFDIVSSIDHDTFPNAAFVARCLSAAGSSLPAKPAHVVLNFGYGFDVDTSWPKRKMRLSRARRHRKHVDLMMVLNGDDLAVAESNSLARSVRLVPGTGCSLPTIMETAESQQASIRAALRSKIGASDKDLVLLYVGRFDKNHHQRKIIECLFYLSRDVKVLFIGNGVLLRRCQERAHALGLQNNAIFCGRVDDVAPYLLAADATLSACRYEGLPKFIVEGLSLGKPSIASAVKGNLEVVENGFNGLTYRLFDEKDFIRAVKTLHFDDALREELAARSEGSIEGFRDERAIDAIAACYREALESRA